MLGILRQYRKLCWSAFFLLFFASLAIGNQQTVKRMDMNLSSDPSNSLIFWITATVLAAGLMVGLVLCRRVKKQTQELYNLWNGCKHSREKVQRSYQELIALIQAAPLAICVLDREGNVRTWNPEAATLFGWSAQEALGRPLRIITNEYQASYRELRRRVQNGEVIRGKEIGPQRKDGARLISSLSIAPLYDESGQFDGSIAILMDMTQRKQAEEDLRASERRYRELFENAKDMIYILDLEGNLTSVNKEVEKIVGYTRKELIGKNILELVAAEHKPIVQQLIRSSNAGASQIAREAELITKDGRRVQVQANARMVYRDSRPSEMEVICRDLSEQKQLQAQLFQAQKMEVVGQLAGGVAHDFNNLLNVIGGYSELVLEEAEGVSGLHHYAEEICKAADQAASVTRQLLAFSRKQVMQPKVLNLNDLMTDLSKMLQRLIGENIQISTVLQPALGFVKADPGQLEQAIMNLIINARDAMPQGGRLMMETANAELDEGYARLHSPCKPGSYVRLAVSDTGMGMDAQTRARIFEPFFTTKPLGKGTGLGLSMVYGIVQQSNGYIWVYSEPGHGTSFKIYLPRVKEIAEFSQASQAGAVPLPRGSETVLVVEDEPPVRELTREFLESNGYQVLDADSGSAALELVKNYPRPIHLLLTDLIMPKMSGKELVTELGKLLPEMKVLYMSGYTDEMIGNHGILEAETHFLQKPFTRDALVNKVREALKQ